MFDTHRRLGKAHEADLEREALNRRLAAEVAKGRPPDGTPARKRIKGLEFFFARVAALVGSRSP